jgi:hypothetical protein
LGRTDFTDRRNDDGTRVLTDFDQASTNSWSTVQTTIDALNRADIAVQTNDDGTKVTTDYDQANTNAWASIQTVADALGRTDIVGQTNDDGTRIVTDYDRANANVWSTVQTIIDAQNRTDLIVQTNDDGSKITTDYDQASTNAWATIQTMTDTLGRTDLVVRSNDDGTKVTTDYDQAFANAWASIETTTDAQGRELTVTTVMDDGSRLLRTNDVTGTRPFDYFVNTYTAAGALASQVEHNRNATTTTTVWDAAFTHAWSMQQTLANAAGTEITTTTLNRNGKTDVHFGGASLGQLVLTQHNGQFELANAATAIPADEVWIPSPGSTIRLLQAGVVAIAEASAVAGAAAVGALVFGLTAFSTTANGERNLVVGSAGDYRFHMSATSTTTQQQHYVNGTWVAVPGVEATLGANGTFHVDESTLRNALPPSIADNILTTPGVVLTPPPPAIYVQATPIPTTEALIPPELLVPNHTGSPPQVWQIPNLSTPIPDANPGDNIVLSTTVVGGRIDGQPVQGAAIPADAINGYTGTIQTLDRLWEQALRDEATRLGVTSGAAYGTAVHNTWKNLILAEQAAGNLPAGIRSEASWMPGGTEAIHYGDKGSIRPDVVIHEAGESHLKIPLACSFANRF